MRFIRPIPITSDATFTRASTGTYFDNAGVLQTAAANTIRLNYDPTNLSKPPSYMIEAAATNSVLFSDALDNAAWIKLFATVTPDAIAGITGATIVDKLIERATNNVHEAYQSFTETNIVRCASVVASAGERGRIKIAISNFVNASVGAIFDLINGVIVAVDAATGEYTQPTAAMTNLGGGRYLCEFSARKGNFNATNVFEIIMMRDTDTFAQAYLGDGVSGVYIGAVQFETGTKATSRIVTTSAPATRAADVLGAGAISNVPETDYPAWTAATFALGARCIIVSAGVHQVWESLQDANTNHPPATSPTWWVLVGATNKWKMFDASVSSQTTNPNAIVSVLGLTSRADSVALMNIDAASVTITQTTSDGVTYNLTQSLVSQNGIVDFYTWCFEPIVRVGDFAITNMPPYGSASLAITLTDTGGTPKCGACVVGLQKDMGGTQYGAKIGIQDYSIKTKDAYGNYSITQRAFNKKADFTVWLDSTQVDQLQQLLAQYRAQPIVYMGSDSYASTFILGYYKDFSIDISYPTKSICSIQIEGLT